MIAFYITSHGYGHAFRSLLVIKALLKFEPVIVVSQVPEKFLRAQLGDNVEIRPRAFDCGMVQVDSVNADVPATLEVARALMKRSPAMLAEEVDFLRQRGVTLVAVDAPALPLEAAYRVGIPGLAVTSFGWDFIYAPFVEQDPGWAEVRDWFRAGYARATALLRYPFSEPMEAIAQREDIPLVASPGQSQREAIAHMTGASLEKPWVLLWFHELALQAQGVARMAALPYQFFSVAPQAWQAPNLCVLSYDFRDLLASCDAVLSKPGFGIFSDCAANQKPLVYVPRTNFRESSVLEECAPLYLRGCPIASEDLYRGDWERALEQARAAPPPPRTLPAGGADFIAARIQWRRLNTMTESSTAVRTSLL